MQLISSKTEDGVTSINQEAFVWSQKHTCTDCNENCKTKRDCYVKQLRIGINKEREGTKWKPISDRTIAVKINRHPILKRDDIELHHLLKLCREKGFTKIFFWSTK